MRSEGLDLRETLCFTPGGGIITFLGQRIMLQDTAAAGIARRELIDLLGVSVARRHCVRVGFAQGWQAAEGLRRDQPELWAEGLAGPLLHSVTGQVLVSTSRRKEEAGLLVDSTWQDSYEAEQHLLHFGLSDEPVCWTLMGFASGYVSNKEEREVLFVEDRCVGKGDPCCHVLGRPKEDWDPAEPQLGWYGTASLDGTLKEVVAKLRKTERLLRTRRQQLELVDQPTDEYAGIVARSEATRTTIERARRVAKTDATILITGESGVGKEVMARLIHTESLRAGKAFVSINCAAIPESLLESELFGYAKGSFTGAMSHSVGLFEAANGGTLLLDEIAEISPGMQAKLLRAVQEREIRRVGESRSRPVDVRILAATNRDLAAEVAAGRFREDLYYRLQVIELRVPPLRERPEDVLPLARFFLKETAQAMRRPVTGFTSSAANRLLANPWPGNARQLRNAIEHAVAMCAGHQVKLEDLPESVQTVATVPRTGKIRPLAEVERECILAAVRAAHGSKPEAAAALGVGVATIYRRLKEYGETT